MDRHGGAIYIISPFKLIINDGYYYVLAWNSNRNHTITYRLDRMKGVEVLNINELANTLKPVVLPGEEMILALVKEGKENDKAVAYLDDGTMIVVENGRRFVGSSIEVTVTSVLQTAAGRMIFARANHSSKN